MAYPSQINHFFLQSEKKIEDHTYPSDGHGQPHKLIFDGHGQNWVLVQVGNKLTLVRSCPRDPEGTSRYHQQRSASAISSLSSHGTLGSPEQINELKRHRQLKLINISVKYFIYGSIIHYFINQPTNQPTSQPTNQTSNQPTNQPTRCKTLKCVLYPTWNISL